MFKLYAENVASVSDLVRTKSISEPGNSICIRSASMFDFLSANPNSTLVLRASFYFVTPKTRRTIPIPSEAMILALGAGH